MDASWDATWGLSILSACLRGVKVQFRITGRSIRPPMLIQSVPSFHLVLWFLLFKCGVISIIHFPSITEHVGCHTAWGLISEKHVTVITVYQISMLNSPTSSECTTSWGQRNAHIWLKYLVVTLMKPILDFLSWRLPLCCQKSLTLRLSSIVRPVWMIT